MAEPTGTPGETPGAGTGGAAPPTGTPGATPATPPPATFDEWLAGQDEHSKGLVTARLQSVEGALRAQRGERDNLAKQIKELSAKAEKGSETERQLQAISAQLEDANQRADFYKDATKPEIGCSNAELAYIAAKAAGAIDQKGRVNWDALKTAYPELFQKKIPAAGAGAGTQNPPQATTMNDFIRQAAGR